MMSDEIVRTAVTPSDAVFTLVAGLAFFPAGHPPPILSVVGLHPALRLVP